MFCALLMALLGSLFFIFTFPKAPETAAPSVSAITNVTPDQGQGWPTPAESNLFSSKTELLSRVARERYFRSMDIQPIEFYGRVEDQDGNPIPQAEITYFIHPTPTLGAGKGSVFTDNDGRFYVSDKAGASISFQLSKKGYLSNATNRGAIFSLLESPAIRYVPNHASPQVIRMWKAQGPEPLIEIDQRYEFSAESATIRIDLLTARIAEEGGDIEVDVSRGIGSLHKGEKFDWQAVIRPIDGGVRTVDTLSEFDAAYRAPKDGYTNFLRLVMAKDAVTWQSGISVPVYVTSRGGLVHSKFVLSLSMNAGSNISISLRRGVANPSGSRNWEINPAKSTRLTPE